MRNDLRQEQVMAEGREFRRYSTAFKRKVVGEIESGKLGLWEARRMYEIGGRGTIQNWIRKLGKNHLLGKIVRVEMVDERDRIRQLRKEKQELESAVAHLHLRNMALESLLEVASERVGYDIKKKIAGEASKGSGEKKK